MRATFTHLIGPHKGERTDFDAAIISIGRAPDNMLCLGDGARRVSSHHAEVIERGDQYLLRDLGSTNGTMINGRRVVVSELEHDDLIEFGAGGPLMRFGLEHGTEKSAYPLERDRSNAQYHETGTGHRSPVSARNNVTLLAALVAAMLLGGIGGIFASSRFRSADPETMSVAEVAEINSPAVVFIRTEFELLDSSGHVMTTEARTGSGFIVSETGLIVTNRHLIRDWEYNPPSPGSTGRITKLDIVLPHQSLDNRTSAEVYKLSSDPSIDVAILKFTTPFPSVANGIELSIGATNQGDEVVVIGYPLGLDLLERTNDTTADPSISTGGVSRVGHDFIQLNLRAYHGNSGGPVINRKGKVIGILTAAVNGAQDIALCTPITEALALVKDHLSYQPISNKLDRFAGARITAKGLKSDPRSL